MVGVSVIEATKVSMGGADKAGRAQRRAEAR
jgi:hypothetical protein